MIWLLNFQGMKNHTEPFCLSILTIYTNDWWFSVTFQIIRNLSFVDLAHLAWDFIEVGQHTYQTG